MTKILFILQNAYHSAKYTHTNRAEWIRDLRKSHTGIRLFRMIPDCGVVYEIINATPEVGKDATSVFEPDLEYINNFKTLFKPDVIVACGKIAQKGCEVLGIDYLKIPHPAWRHLSLKMEGKIKQQITALCTLDSIEQV